MAINYTSRGGVLLGLESFFNPKSIAVIGASNNPAKLGYEVYKNLKKYEGIVYPVNKKETSIQGDKAYKSVLDIPGKVDLGVIVIPRDHVLKAVEESGIKGVKSLIIITGGFGETGDEGKRLEKRILRTARKYGMRIIGPNCVGIMNTWNNLNATFILAARKGRTALISQSGALGAGIIYKTFQEKIGFSKFISLGNMIDVDFAEIIDYLAEDEYTSSIALYIEGLENGRKFIQTAKRVSRKKPIVVLKSGRSSGGARAISSHTGSLAGSYRIYRAAFKQSGIITAEKIDEMLSMARVFDVGVLPKRCEAAVMTNAGGPGVLVSDELEERGIRLSSLQYDTKESLKKILPPIASHNNPVDMVASARGREYYEVLKILMRDPNVGLVVAVCVVPTFAGMTRTEHAEGLIKAYNELGRPKPLIGLFMAGEISSDAKEILEKNNVPVYERPEDVAAAAYALCQHSSRKEV